MTYQTLFLLSRLHKAQREEGNTIYTNFENNTFSGIVDPYGKCEETEPVGFNYTYDQLVSIFEHMQKQGYVQSVTPDWEYLQLTHAGFHYTQTLLSAIAGFFIRSILVPILVAALTAIVVGKINSEDSQPTQPESEESSYESSGNRTDNFD